MSLITVDQRLSAKPFENIIGMFGLPDIIQPPPSPPSVASALSKPGHILSQLKEEPCFITKTVCYTNEQAHWINTVRDEACKNDVESLLQDLRIVSRDFDLEDLCNLTNLDCVVHKALDTYAFIAFTASLDTLDALISMIKHDNEARQQLIDSQGIIRQRFVDFTADCFIHPTYELVALHPEHFLPPGRRLSIYDDLTTSWKTYVVASDRMLRETQDPSSPPLPAFSYTARVDLPPINLFLVILNADIKFRRYKRIQPAPPPLHSHIIQLITRTATLVSLLYWKPKSRQNTTRASVHKLASEEEGHDPMFQRRQYSQRPRFKFPEGADLEARMAIGEALMSGHDLDYDSDDEKFLAELHAGKTFL